MIGRRPSLPERRRVQHDVQRRRAPAARSIVRSTGCSVAATAGQQRRRRLFEPRLVRARQQPRLERPRGRRTAPAPAASSVDGDHARAGGQSPARPARRRRTARTPRGSAARRPAPRPASGGTSGIATSCECGCSSRAPAFTPSFLKTSAARSRESRCRSRIRSRQAHSTRARSSTGIVAQVASCRGDSTTTSCAPSPACARTRPSPRWSSVPSTRSAGTRLGTTRSCQPGPSGGVPSRTASDLAAGDRFLALAERAVGLVDRDDRIEVEVAPAQRLVGGDHHPAARSPDRRAIRTSVRLRAARLPAGPERVDEHVHPAHGVACTVMPTTSKRAGARSSRCRAR